MDFHIVCAADYHQGDETFPEQSRGRQCVATCVMFLIQVIMNDTSIQAWSKPVLHSVLHLGDFLYRELKQRDSSTSICSSDYLHPSDIPSCLKFEEFFVTYKVVSTQSGVMDPHFGGNMSLVTLEYALASVCNGKSNTDLIFISKDSAIGIHYTSDKFYVFDSHARNSSGLPSATGTSVLGVVNDLRTLCCFLRSLLQSLTTCPLEQVQFDLHRIFLTKCKKFKQKRNYLYVPFSHETDSFSRIPRSAGQKRKYIVGNDNTPCAKRHKTLTENNIEMQNSSCRNISRRINTMLPTATHSLSYRQHSTFCMSENKIVCSDGTVEGVEQSGINTGQKDYLLTKLFLFFQNKVKQGPMYICTSCKQTFFRHSVHQFKSVGLKHENIAHKCITHSKSVDNEEWICKTCLMSIQHGKIPSCSVANGLTFPPIPEELKLTSLEERLIAPRLAFMQIRELPRGGQLNLRGNIVNVPADVNSTVKQLPRLLDDTETIPVKFKRKLSYKNYVAFEKIRPNKVMEAAKWLVENSVLFQNEGIEINNLWLNITENQVQEESKDASSATDVASNEPETDIFSNTNNDSDEWTEDENFHDRPTGNTDTVLQPVDFREFNQILSLAPGENSTPLGLFQDIYSEYLAFPSIYCGQPRLDNASRAVPVHYSTICKWELRNVDRRVAMNIPNIFFKLKRLQIKQIRDKVTLAIRKCKTKGRKMTVSEVLSPGFVDNLVKQDDGFRVLRSLRGSPPYWESAKNDVFAMIRQLGMPTWFCSFSAAETKWTPLLRCLSKLVKNKDLSDEEVDALTWQEKCFLIKSDPVTCARYFEHRIQSFIAHVIKDKMKPIGEVADYFYRVEFQQRGSPHVHMLIWIKNAPIYNINSDREVSEFIDKHVTCKMDAAMQELVNYQTHRHARTCRKKGKAICRFNFPLPPMPYTTILNPFPNDENKALYQQKFQKIAEFISQVIPDHVSSFEDLFSKLNMDTETYIKAIRSSLSVPKVFLKRKFEEIRINSYNRTLLKCWEANMDIQYILDPYACVSYIVSYISKGQRGLSNLLYEACRDAKRKDSDMRQQVRRIGNQFLNHVEIGAQEAAYLVLQMPLRKASRDVVFIDTHRSEMRTVLLKSFNSLKELPENSTNVESDNVMKRYKRRPKEMNKYCYADFVSWFETSCHKQTIQDTGISEELPEVDYSPDLEDAVLDALELNDDKVSDIVYEFRDGTIAQKRRKQRVIRYHKISLNVDKEGHYRQLLMLFTSWRNEETDLLHGCITFEESYMKMKADITSVQSRYENISCDLDDTMLHTGDEIEEYQRDSVLPQVEHQEVLDSSLQSTLSTTYGCFDPGTTSQSEQGNIAYNQYDIGQDLGIARKRMENDQLPLKEMEDDDYRVMVQSLNTKQKQFFYNVLHYLKTRETPLYLFLTGGAGVGKSVLLRALYQALLKYYNHQAGENPDNVKLMLCAPTGKAAHNIGGNTIHAAFGIPVGRGFAYKPLDVQQLDMMRCKFFHLKIVFIDEISMVGFRMFNFINLRLQEIKGCPNPFGGVSVIAFGDLFQLKPVMDTWIFSPPPTGLECIAANLWQDCFTVFELDEIMRQKDDLYFAQMLNRLREGNHLIQDVEMLHSRQVKLDFNEKMPEEDNLPHLFTTRAESELHNLSVLSRLCPEKKVLIHAIDNVSGDVNNSIRDIVLSKLPNDASKTMGLQKVLHAGIGPPFELCLNIDVEDGLTNGTPCVLRKFDYRVEMSSRCSIIWVEFEDSLTGVHWRQKYSHLYNKTITGSWTPILEATRSFSIQHYKSYHVIRRQFPLQMAAGKTIHKAQGSTLNNVVLHFGSRKNDHIHYVGLSRVRSLNTIHILELNEKKITISTQVKAEMERLRSTSQMMMCLPDISSYRPENSTTVCFHNCRSLRKHIDDIKNDLYQKHADILALCETRVFQADSQYDIPGYALFCANRDVSQHGLAIYHKDKATYCSAVNIEGLELVITQRKGLNLCFLYCPPKLVLQDRFAKMLNYLQLKISPGLPTVVMGDFNQNALENDTLAQLLHKFSFFQILKSETTDHHSCLDHVYINFPRHSLLSYGILESYYSDHKPLFISVKM